MKKLLFLFSALIAVSVLFSFVRNPSINTQDVKRHHTCRCSSSMGGTASATCQNWQSCSCTTGFFSCTCGCYPENHPGGGNNGPIPNGNRGYKDTEVNPGDRARWDIVSNILIKERNTDCHKLAQEMKGVYDLAYVNRVGYEEKAKQLNEMFLSLPIEIQDKLKKAIE